MKIWIAKDRAPVFAGMPHGVLLFFQTRKPRLRGSFWCGNNRNGRWPIPDRIGRGLKPGECRCAELVIGKKVKE